MTEDEMRRASLVEMAREVSELVSPYAHGGLGLMNEMGFQEEVKTRSEYYKRADALVTAMVHLHCLADRFVDDYGPSDGAEVIPFPSRGEP